LQSEEEKDSALDIYPINRNAEYIYSTYKSIKDVCYIDYWSWWFYLQVKNCFQISWISLGWLRSTLKLWC